MQAWIPSILVLSLCAPRESKKARGVRWEHATNREGYSTFRNLRVDRSPGSSSCDVDHPSIDATECRARPWAAAEDLTDDERSLLNSSAISGSSMTLQLLYALYLRTRLRLP